MRANTIVLIVMMVLPIWITSCKETTIPGISDDEVTMEDILGGWGDPTIKCIVDHDKSLIANVLDLENLMQKNLANRAEGSALYFTKDTAYFIERHETGYYYVKAISSYQLLSNPMRIEMQNDHLMFNAYAPKLYIKKVNDKICLYLLKDEVMKMLEDDGSVSSYMGMIRNSVHDAQFEFHYQKNKLDIYQDIEGGDYLHTDWD